MADSNPPTIYESANPGHFFSPFNIDVDPMERLLLINIEKDPDDTYFGFEPQVFDHPVIGKGMIVLAYRTDKKIDIYAQPGLNLDGRDYDIVGEGLNKIAVRPMEDAVFEVTPAGLHAAFSFEDMQGRMIEVFIQENRTEAPKTMDILAPLGSSTVKPPSMPVLFLYDFGFVRRSGTTITVQIDGKSHKPDRFPMPILGEWVYFTRYSATPLIIAWNPNYKGPITPVPKGTTGLVHHNKNEYTLVDNHGHPEIACIRPSSEENPALKTNTVALRFSPPIPDLACIKDNVQVDGSFVFEGGETLGQVSGVYSVHRQGSSVALRVHPSGGWQPRERRFSVRMIFTLASIFRYWPKTYEWNAALTHNSTGGFDQISHWRRIKA